MCHRQIDSVIIAVPISQRMKMRHREGKHLGQDLITGKYPSQDSNPAPEDQRLCSQPLHHIICIISQVLAFHLGPDRLSVIFISFA